MSDSLPGALARTSGLDERMVELAHRNSRLEQRILALTEELVRMKGELHRARGRLAALSTADELTGLLNWRALRERGLLEIARAMRYEREMGLVVLAPDPPGSAPGPLADEAARWRALAEICQSQHRTCDVAGRAESGEIVILLPETSVQGAIVLAERIGALHARRFGATVSSGCAGWPAHGRGLEALLAAALQALSAARNAGRSSVRAAPAP